MGFNHLEGNGLLVDVDANELVQVSPSFILASEEVDPLVRRFYIWVALVDVELLVMQNRAGLVECHAVGVVG